MNFKFIKARASLFSALIALSLWSGASLAQRLDLTEGSKVIGGVLMLDYKVGELKNWGTTQRADLKAMTGVGYFVMDHMTVNAGLIAHWNLTVPAADKTAAKEHNFLGLKLGTSWFFDLQGPFYPMVGVHVIPGIRMPGDDVKFVVKVGLELGGLLAVRDNVALTFGLCPTTQVWPIPDDKEPWMLHVPVGYFGVAVFL